MTKKIIGTIFVFASVVLAAYFPFHDDFLRAQLQFPRDLPQPQPRQLPLLR